MKKFAMFVGLALVMLATSCTTDVTSDVNVNGAKVTLGVSLDQTRTYMGDAANGEYPVLWSEGDKVLVNNVAVAVPSEAVGKSELKLAADAAEKYELAYPAELVKDGVLTISEVQKFVEGSFAQGAGVMVGYSTTEEVTLKNLYGYLKFTVTAAENVNAVTVTAAGGEAISGTFALDYQNATITPLAGKDIIRVTDVVATKGVATVVVAVPAGEYTKGFTVKVKANDKGVMTKTLQSDGHVVEAGVVYALPAVAYAEAAKETAIMSVSDLQAFIEAANTVVEVEEGQTAPCPYADWISEDGEVKLGADLNLEGVDLTPINTFDGVFNGQGFALKNWTTSEGLFTANSGTIKNVVIDESCTLTLPVITADSLIGFIVDTNTGLVSGCVNNADITLNYEGDLSVQYKAGAIVGYSSGSGKISNCINNGDFTITIAAITGSSDYFGGVVGNTSMGDGKYVAMENCVNTGDVSVTVNGGCKNVYLGGVSGACNSKGIINGCINSGNVSFYVAETGGYPNMGGVVGYTACYINYCYNYGNVSFESAADSTSRPAVAGIAGYVSRNVKGCENHGDISAEGVKFAKASAPSNAGAGGEQWPAFGGVFGCVGSVANNGTADIEDCVNYGNVFVSNPNGSCRFGAAGVVGEPCGNVKNCHNHGNVEVTGGSQVYLGGVVGYWYSAKSKTMSDCTNSGDLLLHHGTYYHGENKSKDVSEAGYNYIGGVMGSVNAYGNAGAEDVTTFVNCENTGFLKSDAKLPVLSGGLFGTCRGLSTNCVNRGDVESVNTYAPADAKKSAAAGIAGFGGGSTEGCENYGKVTISQTEGPVAASAFLGVVGNTAMTHVGATVKCDVVSDNGIAVLIAGQNKNEKTVTLGTAEAPIVIEDVTLNGAAVTAENLAETLATGTEEANVANIVYEIGTTVVVK